MPAALRVGNDVVDLGDPWIATVRERFVARVCCEEERERVAVARDPRRLLWSLFAAKEAAFKVVSKLGPPPVFAHRRFVVAEDLGSVRYEDLSLPAWIRVDEDFVHALVSTTAELPCSEVARAAEGDLSASARALLRAALAGRLGCSADELEIARAPAPGSWDGFAPPVATRRGAALDVDVSLSHDGRFVAFAMSPSE